MNKKLEMRILALLESGRKIEAIKELRTGTGMGLQEAKDEVEALEAKLPTPKLSATLLTEYKSHISQALEMLPNLTVPDTLDATPSLAAYLDEKVDKWCIMYNELRENSIFKTMTSQFGTVQIGSNQTTSGAFLASHYDEITAKVNLHLRMMATMNAVSFPGRKP